jgi:hypothetical protein
MDKIIKCRAREQICRQRAVFDLQRKHYWLSQAGMWWHRAQDEISAHFEACGSAPAGRVPATRQSDMVHA